MITKSQIKPISTASDLTKVFSSNLFWITSFSILTFLAAQIEVPVQPVPFTLQTMIVLLAGAFLGPINGAISQLVYLAAGALGLPVFAGFGFGFATLLGPTGGYLVAFPIAAFIVGYFIQKNNKAWVVALSMLLGTLSILLIGSLYLSLFMKGNLEAALISGTLVFVWWSLLKIAASTSIYISLKKKFPSLPNHEA